MDQNNLVVMVALICLTALEIAALACGINGQLFTLVTGLIAGLAGFKLKDGSAAIKSWLKP